MNAALLVNSALFGLGLAVEALLVAMANGLYNANGRVLRGVLLAILFAACHFGALAAGYALIGVLADATEKTDVWFTAFAVAVLAALGVKSIVGGLRKKEQGGRKLAAAECVIQSVAASFDAFAVGLTLSEYSAADVTVCGAVIFAIITSFYCIGYFVGNKFGKRLSKYASALGGVIFIGLALEILIKSKM